jgi:hypothetical protein
MNEDVEFLKSFRHKGALIDTNLLLVYVVGQTDPRLLKRNHHTKQYESDFPLVKSVVEYFQKVYTTPNILTEVSNLGQDLKEQFFATLGNVTNILAEEYCASRNAVADSCFRKLGLTDAGVAHVSGKCLVVTADFALYQTLRNRNIAAVNFNHIRASDWAAAP